MYAETTTGIATGLRVAGNALEAIATAKHCCCPCLNWVERHSSQKSWVRSEMV